MKLSEIIMEADRMRPNGIPEDAKIRRLWSLEGEISEFMGVSIPELSEVVDPVMLMPDPYSEMYILYLLPYIDFENEESDLYQMDMITANTALDNAKRWYRRTHRPPCNVRLKGVYD